MKTSKGQTAFVFSGAQVWNNLPTHLKQAQSIRTFQKIRRIPYSIKYMITIKIKIFFQTLFYSFSICLGYFLVGPRSIEGVEFSRSRPSKA